ncbi:sensor histidine kinase [Kineococcus sp. LSe6-4]|uniref:Sensor histidine kinase n=1 Tax=Kineococcus halophytocola TaxID=3234027 RepID=A0ABV4GYT8_9ACTN
MDLLGRWRAADDPRRVELYTHWSLVPLAFLGPLVVAGVTAGAVADSGAAVAVAVAASLVQALALAVLLSRAVRRRPTGRAVEGAWIATSVLAHAAGVLALRTSSTGRDAVDVVAAVAAVAAVVPLGRWRFRRYAPLAVLVVGVATFPFTDRFAMVLTYAFYGVFLAAVVQMSLWMMEVVRRLAGAERDRTRLAVAEERLRFARDLHDVVGRDLSAIAVTSDLVAELARRGRPEAVERAEEVRSIAHGSLDRIRSVVRGYRTVDLATELEGSVALLESAGVACTLEHPDQDGPLPDELRSAAAWVIREGVTNVVRHSAATWCRISVRQEASEFTVRLENDGVPDRPAGRGSGLLGLAERLQPLGGRLDTSRRDGTFTLHAHWELP